MVVIISINAVIQCNQTLLSFLINIKPNGITNSIVGRKRTNRVVIIWGFCVFWGYAIFPTQKSKELTRLVADIFSYRILEHIQMH